MKRLLLLVVMLSLMVFLSACGEEEKEETTVSLYFLEESETTFELAEETREIEDASPNKALDLLFQGPESDEYGVLITEETKLKDFWIEENIAHVDFSSEISQAAFGSEPELLLIQSVVYTLVQFEEVDKVQFLIEGDIVDSIAGHIYTGEPISKDDI
ncbi:GerMN domain-containing protein [Natranaerobius trueperi]|uniref:GerMN domain-containing protein n=1 Tax=Natranaerobius trueperi TaxID=759412 RepID=A0A226C2N4_9FIRM|nr:GerMN domain-containing protein [Natranaerobius trueperi]OWZ84884.1 hypothetical protein CDO51_00310 [Natranaerobius trueperi]